MGVSNEVLSLFLKQGEVAIGFTEVASACQFADDIDLVGKVVAEALDFELAFC
jgi:hypothetical protein